ncbi:MAG: helix-turn-helix transcriptional regulator [Clostridia bacterium]|nr:helix-turn-helix transcriptional regulator [Clostridia bacterium]
MTMGQIIKKLRKERDLTQEELAEQLNITAQAVSRWESGTGMPDISQVVPLANAFGVSTDVLFGMQDQDADAEVERFIRETEYKICNRPEGVQAFMHNLECCNAIQELVKKFPNHYKLLQYSMGHIVCLLDFYRYEDELKDKTDEKKAWENECIRQGKLILSHCTDSKYLCMANSWLSDLYRGMKMYDKAEEYAKNLSEFDPFTDRGSTLALVYSQNGKTEDALKQYGRNIDRIMDHLENQLIRMGHIFSSIGKQEEAYACYRLYPDIYDLMVGDREDEVPYYLNSSYDYCALTCMRLGKPKEAMDWLEKWIHHERVVAKNYNVITVAKMPYYYGIEQQYSKDFYPIKDQITPTLAWKAFDPIRETERFRAILADAEAFERGE